MSKNSNKISNKTFFSSKIKRIESLTFTSPHSSDKYLFQLASEAELMKVLRR